MLNMTEYSNVAVVVDNKVVVNGLEFKVSDEVCQSIMDLITGKKRVSDVNSTVTVNPADNQPSASLRAEYNDVKCKWAVEEVTTPDGKKFYRIVDGIFTFGKWTQSKYHEDEEYRIPVNQEAHKIATNKVKALKGCKVVEMVKDGWKAYGFTSKKAAEEALKSLPTHIQKVEIAEYVAEHGAIKAKAVKRKKTA